MGEPASLAAGASGQRSRLVRLATHPLGWSLVVGAALVVGLPRLHRALVRQPLPVFLNVPAFSLTDQAGQPFGLANLKGHPTIVDFIFTSCPTICPLLSAKMERLQARTRDLPDVKLLSISVDPADDTPAVLTKYGARFHEDPKRWTFVTGDPAMIEQTVVGGFKIELERKGGDPSAAGSIIHGGNLVLVDGQGRIRGYYESDPDGLRRIVEDAGRLSKGES